MEHDLNKINHEHQNMEAYWSQGGEEESEEKIGEGTIKKDKETAKLSRNSKIQKERIRK